MSEKELLYLEDALNHQKHLETKCYQFANQLQNEELRMFSKNLETKSKSIFEQLFQLLN